MWSDLTGQWSIDRPLLRRVEEREQPVIVFLCDRIVLMVVALRATNGEAKPHCAERVGAVDHRLHAKLLGVCSAFAVGEGVALKTGRNLRTRNKISGDLLYGELVKRHVTVESVDHPV